MSTRGGSVRVSLACLVFATALVLGGAQPPPAPAAAGQPTELSITHGVASGDVTATGAVIWARANGPARVQVEYDTDREFRQPRAGGTADAAEARDFTARVKLGGLAADTAYHYRVSLLGGTGGARSQSVAGSFKTAPDRSTARAVSFVVGGDVAGQRYCRRVGQEYAIFSRMLELGPDFFIANGDMVYTDGDCPAEGPEGWQNIPGDFENIADPSLDWTDLGMVRENFRRHWRYNRTDPQLRRFLQATSMYSQWDDHEVINDFGAPWAYWNAANRERPGYPNLVTAGRDALFEYSPIDRHPAEPNRIYRSFNWGRDLDLFIIDARSYRSRNDLADTPENAKTLLGREQLEWLKQGLLKSPATWKVVSSDVPISIPTGSNPATFGRDGWASGTEPDFSAETGFERELGDLLRFLDDNDVANVVFVATDVHFAQNIRYQTDPNGDSDTLLFHELVSGPLNAIRLQPPAALDPTFGPTSLYAEGGIFNFGYVRIERQADGLVHLLADVRGEDGQPRPGSLLDLTPATAAPRAARPAAPAQIPAAR
jgi:alkaline phosphatase D